MKKTFTIITALLMSLLTMAQSPGKMSYQAVIRNAAGELITEQQVGIRISILQGSATGSQIYSETQTPITNANGLISLEFGGIALLDINWTDGPFFIKTETDPSGGSNYTIMGVSQILSVPYAFHAHSADVLTGEIEETDPVFTAWDKSTGIEITESQITDMQDYLIEETDPIFSAWDKSTGIVISESQISDMDNYLTNETDPLFTAWDKSTGIVISESQISDLQEYLTGESDPIFSAWDMSTGIVISESQISDLDNYLTNETDPLFTAWDKSTGIVISESQISDLQEYLTGESDPIFTENIDVSNAIEGQILKFDGNKFVSSQQQTLLIDGHQLSLTDGNTVSLPSSNLPVLTTSEILALNPQTGESVYNVTQNFYQIYTGTNWVSIPANCWPQPSEANAGEDQSFTGSTTATTLAANSPETGHGTGIWSIISGEGGSLEDVNDPATNFTGQHCEVYTLLWTITTECGATSDEVALTFNHTPTQADAGPNQIITDGTTSTTLHANIPVEGIGQWSIISGQGGSFVDDTDPGTIFTGQHYQEYILRWTIETNCHDSADEISVFVSNGTNHSTQVVEVLNPATGKIWMDRNLGAARTANSSNDSEAYGHLYQWGRDADWHQLRNSGTTSTLSANDTPGHSDFITTTNQPNDWRSPQNDDLWQGVEGVNNPCPNGFRLPTAAEFESEIQSWGSNNASGAIESPLKLPLAGHRLMNGSIFGEAITGSYWSSTPNATNAMRVFFNDNDARIVINNRVFGFSVRCIKDSTTPSTHTLDLQVLPAGSGEVSGAGDYEAGEEVTITATPNTGYAFVNWTGDTEYLADANASSTTLTMPAQNVNLTANLEEDGGDNGDDTEVVEVLNPATGKTWMDRNLGASRAATSSTDVEAFGHLYQWGRAADGHQLRTSGTTSTLSISDNPGHGDFITTPEHPNDWHSLQKDNLWLGLNGINNPCPSGFRLPTIIELDEERQSWISNDSWGAYNSPLKLLAAGFRHYMDGSIHEEEQAGYYWSSNISDMLAQELLFTEAEAYTGNARRGYGSPVRCIKD